MSAIQKVLILGADGLPLPQYYDAATDSMVALGTMPIRPTNVIKAALLTATKTWSGNSPVSIQAGASAARANRYRMMVSLPITASTSMRFGESDITATKGVECLPGNSITFEFDPSVSTIIYGVNTVNGATPTYEVVELA